jgi:ankyrin repeat protein
VAFTVLGCGGIRAVKEADDCEPIRAMSYAIRLGHADRVRELLDLGVSPDIDLQNGWTPLGWALSWNQEGVARLLIERGANVNGPILRRYPPVRLAKLRGMKTVVKLMEDRGAVDLQLTASRATAPAGGLEGLEATQRTPFPGNPSSYDSTRDR